MDFSTDDLRRELRDARRAQAEAMGPTRDLFQRLFEDESTSAADRAAALLGPLARRRFLRIGGFSVLGAAVLAACGGPGDQGSVPVAGTGATTTSAPPRVVNDAVILRTASSLEFSVIEVYDLALDSGLIPDAAMADAARDLPRPAPGARRAVHLAHAGGRRHAVRRAEPGGAGRRDRPGGQARRRQRQQARGRALPRLRARGAGGRDVPDVRAGVHRARQPFAPSCRWAASRPATPRCSPG